MLEYVSPPAGIGKPRRKSAYIVSYRTRKGLVGLQRQLRLAHDPEYVNGAVYPAAPPEQNCWPRLRRVHDNPEHSIRALIRKLTLNELRS
jgi:hypothetical protein